MRNRERESGNRTEKPGTGKVIFSRNGNEKDHFPVPVHAVSINSYEINGEVQINLLGRGNPNGNSCFPVRRTGTLLVLLYSIAVEMDDKPVRVKQENCDNDGEEVEILTRRDFGGEEATTTAVVGVKLEVEGMIKEETEF